MQRNRKGTALLQAALKQWQTFSWDFTSPTKFIYIYTGTSEQETVITCKNNMLKRVCKTVRWSRGVSQMNSPLSRCPSSGTGGALRVRRALRPGPAPFPARHLTPLMAPRGHVTRRTPHVTHGRRAPSPAAAVTAVPGPAPDPAPCRARPRPAPLPARAPSPPPRSPPSAPGPGGARARGRRRLLRAAAAGSALTGPTGRDRRSGRSGRRLFLPPPSPPSPLSSLPHPPPRPPPLPPPPPRTQAPRFPARTTWRRCRGQGLRAAPPAPAARRWCGDKCSTWGRATPTSPTSARGPTAWCGECGRRGSALAPDNSLLPSLPPSRRPARPRARPALALGEGEQLRLALLSSVSPSVFPRLSLRHHPSFLSLPAPTPPSLRRWVQLTVSFRFAPAFIFFKSCASGVGRCRYFLRLRSAIAEVQEGGEGGKCCWQPRVPSSALRGLTWLQQPEVVGDKKGGSERRSCCRCLTSLRTCWLCCRAGRVSACVNVCRWKFSSAVLALNSIAL